MCSPVPAVLLALLLCALVAGHAPAPSSSPSSEDFLEFVSSADPYILDVSSTKSPWLLAGNLASAGGLSSISTLTFPVAVNIYAVGFDGSGNLGVKIPTEQLSAWLEHLSHTLPHRVVPLVQSDEAFVATRATEEQDAPSVQYRYQFNLIEVDPSVTVALEYQLHTTYRNVASLGDSLGSNSAGSGRGPHHQVDPNGVTALLDDLVGHLSLGGSHPLAAYSIFLLNPKSGWSEVPNSTTHHYKFTSYGYRAGFSNVELDAVLKEEQPGNMDEDPPFPDPPEPSDDPLADMLGREGETGMPGMGDVGDVPEYFQEWEKEQGAADPAQMANDFAEFRKWETEHSPSADPEQWQEDFEEFSQYAREDDTPGSFHEEFARFRAVTADDDDVFEDPTIAGLHDDFEALDILEGTDVDPKESGGEEEEELAKKLDIEHHKLLEDSRVWAEQVLQRLNMLPSGPLTISDYRMMLRASKVGMHYLDASAGDLFAQEECLVDSWTGPGRQLMVDFSAGPFSWGPVVGGEGVRTRDSFPHVDMFASVHQSPAYKEEHAEAVEEERKAKEAEGLTPEAFGHFKFREDEQQDEVEDDEFSGALYDWDSLHAEKQVLEDFLTQQCDHLAQDNAACKESRGKMHELESFLSRHGPQSKLQVESLRGKHAFSFFNDGFHVGHQFNAEVDQFLSQLAATLTSSLHQSVTPAASDHRAAFTSRVAFHVYVLANHRSYEPLSNGFMERFRAAMRQLEVRGATGRQQEFTFAVHKLTMADDPVLSMAFSRALKSSVVPTLRLDGQFSAIKRLYLDSRELEAALQKLHEGDDRATRDSRDVPIFLFSLDYPLPVFIDKHFQSKAMEHMVVAVQSRQHLWESHLACNDKPIYWNLRDPLRSVLASTATLLGGLLPPHMSFSGAHNRTVQNWLWAADSSPMTPLNSGTHFSQLQIDAVHRNYVVQAATRAATVVNAAVRKLAAQRTTLGNEILELMDAEAAAKQDGSQAADTSLDALRSATLAMQKLRPGLRNLAKLYKLITRLLARMSAHVGQFEFDEAVRRIRLLDRAAERFAFIADVVVERAQRFQCAQPAVEEPLSEVYWMAAVLLCLVGVVVRLVRGRGGVKPKVN